jgi:hypothetical protein
VRGLVVVVPGREREANVDADPAQPFELPPSARVLDEGQARVAGVSTWAAKFNIYARSTDASIFAKTRCPQDCSDRVVLLLIERSKDLALSIMA